MVENEPSDIEIPVDRGPPAAPGSARLVGAILNLTAPGGFDIADVAMFEVRYGTDGRPAEVSQLIEGPGHVTSGAGATLTGCPAGGSSFSMDPTPAGGVQFTLDDGSGLPLALHFDPIAFPSPRPTGFAPLDVAADGLVAVANSSLETVPGIGEYNTAVYGLNVAASAVNGDFGDALSSAVFSFGIPALGERSGIPDTPLRGPAQFSAWEFSAGVAESVNDRLTPARVDVEVDAPLCAHTRRADLYIDPSGRVVSTRGAAISGAKVTISSAPARSGPFRVVPAGSALLSPGNRRNPDRTNVFGSFGWDVLPGFYRITVSHPGCRAAGGAPRARTPTLRIPPPIDNLVLRLRCPHLRLAGSRTSLIVSGQQLASGTARPRALVLTARVRAARGARRPTGVVTFLAGRRLGSLSLDRSGRAVLTLPRVPAGRLRARYSGSGRFAPSSSGG